MPLFLNSEPFKLTQEQLAKYSNDTIYRVGTQFIVPVPQIDLAESPHPYFIGLIHIPCSYYMYEMVDGQRTPKGQLVWAESAIPRPEVGQNHKEFVPSYIGIGNVGSMTVNEYEQEKNYFLDNHPMNEVVKNNPKHPNYHPKVDSCFATYSETRVADRRQLELDIAYEVETKLRERDKGNIYVMNHNMLKAVAGTMMNAAVDNQLHLSDLMRYDSIDEKTLRQRLISVTKRYPVQVKEALESHGIDYSVMIETFKEAGILELVGNQWIHRKNSTTKDAFLKVPDSADSQDWLYLFFKDRDNNGKYFKEIKETYKKQQARLKTAAEKVA